MPAAENNTGPAPVADRAQRHTHSRSRRTRHGARRTSLQVAGIAATIAAGVAITSGGVYAALTAEAFNASAQNVGSGTLMLTLNNTTGSVGFGSPIANIAPGDVVNRYVQVRNTGTLTGQNLTLGLADSTPTLLTTSTTKGLTVAVSECSVAWTMPGGTCSGTSTAALTLTPAATVISSGGSTPVTLAAPAFTSSTDRYFRVSVTLPDLANAEVSTNGALPAVGTTIQGLAANLTWKFTLAQRTPTTTNT
ncbi:CalY family protein [Kineococcus sp. NBC_00420]|uniref:TasA family protein n=1 Tax=Kineococcus sp. NBC_00420 TaxID=2903564 RepID=UPI002E1D3B28